MADLLPLTLYCTLWEQRLYGSTLWRYLPLCYCNR